MVVPWMSYHRLQEILRKRLLRKLGTVNACICVVARMRIETSWW